MSRRILVFGAHPDDCDLNFGGTAIQLTKAGHQVKFVAVTNGEAGHFRMEPADLARRRYGETQAAAKLSGVCEYEVLDNRDARMENTLVNREKLTRIIRRFQPDLVLSHRICDYHPDHRAVAQIVLDTTFMVGVPLFCRDTPVPEVAPVYGYTYDPFTDPRPLRADAAVNIDPVLSEKYGILDCHASQFYEWMPWCDFGIRDMDASKMTRAEKMDFIDSHWGCNWVNAANLARQTLVETYGDAGKNIRHAEVFEYSPYGRKVSLEEFRAFFR